MYLFQPPRTKVESCVDAWRAGTRERARENVRERARTSFSNPTFLFVEKRLKWAAITCLPEFNDFPFSYVQRVD